MSDKRKLLAEVERTFKKIYEGIEIFDEIWAKLQDAGNPGQKDKYEVDLKKEIKKLQRLRDQVKTWITSSSELKDKEPLLKARRDIETKMERFKDIEREAKIKNYSNIALAQETKIDVNVKKKHDARDALSQFIEKMHCGLEQFESEMEALTNNAKKKKTEKEVEKVDFLTKVMESHRNHITKMEIMLRMLDNESLTPDYVESVSDDFEFYLDKVQEEHLEDINYIYVGVDLDESAASRPVTPEPSVASKESFEKVKLSEDPAVEPVYVPAPVCAAAPPQAKPVDAKPVGLDPLPPKPAPNPPVQPALIKPYAAVVQLRLARAVPQTVIRPTTQHPPVLAGKAGYKKVPPVKPKHPAFKPRPGRGGVAHKANSSKRPPADFHSKMAKKSPVSIQSSLSPSPIPTGISGSSYTSSLTSRSASGTPEPFLARESNMNGTVQLPTPMPFLAHYIIPEADFTLDPASPDFTVQSISPEPPQLHGLPRAEDERNPWSSPFLLPLYDHNTSMTDETLLAPGSRSQSRQSSIDLDKVNLTLETFNHSFRTADVPSVPPISLLTRMEVESQLAPVVAQSLGLVDATRDTLLQHRGLEAALHNPPKPGDSERQKPFHPCTPCAVPAGWPTQSPLPFVCDKFYAGLPTDVLFFIFYFEEGSLAQLYAATALKNKHWRFHKKLNAWFRRLEEPTEMNREYERGDYKCWDLESWSEQERRDFVFEYRYLEDVDLTRYDHSGDFFSLSAVLYLSLMKDHV